MTKLLFLLLLLFGCSPTEPELESLCNENIEVELWGHCYNINETTSIYLYNVWDVRGEIPSEIGDLINLTYLNLGQNELTGEIPSSKNSPSLLQSATLGLSPS